MMERDAQDWDDLDEEPTQGIPEPQELGRVRHAPKFDPWEPVLEKLEREQLPKWVEAHVDLYVTMGINLNGLVANRHSLTELVTALITRMRERLRTVLPGQTVEVSEQFCTINVRWDRGNGACAAGIRYVGG